MPLPKPELGLVLPHAFLWRHERDAGLDIGTKIRPAVIVLALQQADTSTVVTVLPINHLPPKDLSIAIEIPLKVKQHLGLDDERSWIILGELNEFAWPGFDLTPVPGKKDVFEYGFLPPKLFGVMQQRVLDLIIQRRIKKTHRD